VTPDVVVFSCLLFVSVVDVISMSQSDCAGCQSVCVYRSVYVSVSPDVYTRLETGYCRDNVLKKTADIWTEK